MRPASISRSLAVLVLLATTSAQAARVERASPQGSVRDVRQLTLSFDADMVALGDPRLPAPADIECAVSGSGRWVDTRHWAYDFERVLPAGLRCGATLKSDLQSVAGAAISGTRSFRFDTGGPAVRGSMPYDSARGIDGEQVFVLRLDAQATATSVQAHAWCAVDNLAERLPVRLLEGEARQRVLEQRRELGYAYQRLLHEDGDDDARPLAPELAARREQNLLLLQCARPLPDDSGVDLVWGTGIESSGGVATRSDQVLRFHTRAAFTASFSCDRVNPQAGCVPVLPMSLRFSSPVPAEQAARVRIEGGGVSRKPDAFEDGARFVDRIEFAPPFAEDQNLKLTLPAELRDDAGRTLANADRYPLDLRTDPAPPLAKFAAEFGILELKQGGVLPVTLRDVEDALPAQRIGGQSLRMDDERQIIDWMARIRRNMNSRWENGQSIAPGIESVFDAGHAGEAFEIPRPAGGKAFEVIGIPLAKPGFHVVEIASPRLGAALIGPGKTRYVATSALVTNLAVHFKWGRESSLVFVTTLDKGTPVADAEIKILDGCNAGRFWEGRSDGNGIARIANDLPRPETWSSCSDADNHPLLISARHGDDFSFAFSNWNEGIKPYDFNLQTGFWDDPAIGHSVLDRSLFRAGETVSMKHYWRQHQAGGITVPADAPDKLVIEHIGGEQHVELPLHFDAHGIATSEWRVPDQARLGEYRLRLQRKDESIDSGSFRVEQYRVPLMRALIEAPKEAAIAVQALPLDLYVGYYSGGGASGLPVKLRSQVQPRIVDFAHYDGYRFDGEALVEGVVENGEYDGEDRGKPATSRTQVYTLDASGAARATIDELPAPDSPRTLITELEYTDANGQIATVRNSTALWPAGVVVGIEAQRWTQAGQPLPIRGVVLDTQGKPASNRPVTITLYQRETHGYRKRLVGGFYAYSSSTRTRRVDAGCKARSDAQGLFTCSIDADDLHGDIAIEAVARDEEGRKARAVGGAWISGHDDDWFAQGDSDRMDVIPQQRQVAPGQKLELQVRSPFRHATALVSIEREGVLDAFVTEISGRDPVIDVPMLDRYAPNVYVSVLALRPRINGFRSRIASFLRWMGLDRWFDIEGGNPTATVDLSKPAYRLGIASVDVGWDAHRLLVEVKPAQAQYKTRERAMVEVNVRTADGKPLPEGAEVAFSAVDEALLDLLPNPSTKLLEAMMQRRGIEVLTATAQMQVIGKRHYGRKSAAPGGGGGRGAPRELLNSLLSWQARVPLDAQGHAQVAVPLNDALSAFRFTAVASAGADRFGEGHASVRTTQDVQLLSGLPPLVRSGDAYSAPFTLRNTGDATRRITVSAALKPVGGAELLAPAPQQVELAAQSAQTLHFAVTAPERTGELEWTISASGEDGDLLDALRVNQQVSTATPLRVQQATLLQLDAPQQLAVAAPADALRERQRASGGVRVALSRSLVSSLSGVRDYMSAYPYSCNEQRASRAIALDDRALWDALMQQLPAALDDDGLARYFAAQWLTGSDVLTAYLLQLSDVSGWEIPEATRERMLAGLQRYAEGRIQRGYSQASGILLPRRLAAIEALARYQRARPEWLDALNVETQLLPTSALIDWIGILQRLDKLPRREQRLADAQAQLRGRLDLQGTTLSLADTRDDWAWWLMSAPDVDANRAILALLDDAGFKGDLPRLVRGSIGLQRRGHWSLTTANAWGALALRGFAQRYEATPVSGSTRAQLGDDTQQAAWPEPAQPDPAPLDLPWPVDGSSDTTLSLSHDGSGAPWALIQSRAAVPLREPYSAGYRIRREIVAVERKQADRWSVGDVARIRIEIEASADMGWVVVDDPVPAGASIVGQLGRDSALLASGEARGGDAWPAFEERRFDAYRAYYEYLPKGKASTEYTIRFNNAGRYTMPATRVEAMYAPERYAESPNAIVDVVSQ